MDTKCSYFGCENFICADDADIQQGMKFCQEHHDQLTKLVEEHKIPQIIGFWVKANGGAERLASTF